ncbi:MAG TPA: PAS domain-containing sensor histidine kinase [Verrucomicrobiae bacterium]|jgi:signal transduction histidine kinase|nr:PAS domain-containing sensor histidine kinase [Verrucomicrobiae bacterium]
MRTRPKSKNGKKKPPDEFSQLKRKLSEAQETLEAIQSGDVDAVVVNGPRGNQIYALSGADQPYRVYVERMQEGAVTISHRGLVLYANRRFADMIHKPLEQVIGTDITGYLNSVACGRILRVIANQNEAVKFESALKLTNDSGLPVYLTASYLPLQGQSVVCLVVTDLSAQKQNEELRMAKEVAEKANNAKDAFLAALSHELRTPLNPVLLLASEGAEDHELPQRARLDFATIRDNIELEARLIDDLLDLNRIAHGKLALNRKNIDCHDVLDNAIAIVEPDIRRKKISLTLNLEKKPCPLIADRTRLQQIFWNVLNNAVKFTPEKGKITVATAVAPDRKQCSITVTDSGIGLTQEEIRRIFDAFAQGEHAQESGPHKFGGLGLGLSISQMLVKMHEGSISAHSKGTGHGATFTIQLPCADGR